MLRGTDDGIHGSNTFFLAMVRGWQGICVEADTSNFATIETASGRKDGLHLAVAEREGPIEFRTYGPCKQGKGALCGHHAGIESARGDSSNAGGSLVQVNAVTPSRLLSEHYAPNATIDFVSMDIEGGEFAVLRSWPWHRYCVNVRLPPRLDATSGGLAARPNCGFRCAVAQVWSLENWRTPRDLRPAYEQLLGPHGYLHSRRISNDEIFVRHPRCPVQGMLRNGQHGTSLVATSHAAHGVSDISHRRADGSGGGKGGEAERSAVQRGSCSRGSRIRAPERCLSKDAVAAVRCCGGAQCYSICWAGQRPYTSSRWELPPRLGTNGLRANWSAAAAECDAHGLRLCSASEFASDQCCRSGCGMDKRAAWTGEYCAL